MNTYKQIFLVLFGKFKSSNVVEYLKNALRVIYIIALLPSLIFIVLLGARSGFGEEKGKIGIVKKILLHISMIFWSFVSWGIIYQIILGKYS